MAILYRLLKAVSDSGTQYTEHDMNDIARRASTDPAQYIVLDRHGNQLSYDPIRECWDGEVAEVRRFDRMDRMPDTPRDPERFNGMRRVDGTMKRR